MSVDPIYDSITNTNRRWSEQKSNGGCIGALGAMVVSLIALALVVGTVTVTILWALRLFDII